MTKYLFFTFTGIISLTIGFFLISHYAEREVTTQEEQEYSEENPSIFDEVDLETEDRYTYTYKFEDYPSRHFIQESQAPLDLDSHYRGWQFKTRIRDAYAKGPDFAGHYTVVMWGCGISCQNHIIVDNLTGKIIDAEIGSSEGVEYTLESELFVVNPPESIKSYQEALGRVPDWLETRYYKLSEDGLRMEEME